MRLACPGCGAARCVCIVVRRYAGAKFMGPGSAAQRYTLHRVRDTMATLFRIQISNSKGYASAFSRRDTPELCVNFHPLEHRARRESRAPTAAAVVATTSPRAD